MGAELHQFLIRSAREVALGYQHRGSWALGAFITAATWLLSLATLTLKQTLAGLPDFACRLSTRHDLNCGSPVPLSKGLFACRALTVRTLSTLGRIPRPGGGSEVLGKRGGVLSAR